MELCFNVRTFFSTVYLFRSFLILPERICTPSIAFRFSPLYNADGTIKLLFSKRESVLVALIKVLECADKRCILPKQKNPFPKWQDVLSKR